MGGGGAEKRIGENATGGARPHWQQEADRIGAVEVVAVKSIPLDRRHRSKVDYPALRALMAAARR
jgi:hypothetical protein